MAKKEYTFKYDDYNKKVNEGIEPRFKFSEIDSVISEDEEDTSIDDLSSDEEELESDMEEIDQSIEENDSESNLETEEEPSLDMGDREDASIDTLKQMMRNINDYMKILNNNLKLEDTTKLSKKMIEDIEKINNILF